MKNLRSLWLGILLGVVAIVAMGIVYIDTTQNYWRVGGANNGYVQLIVSNKIVISVSTNSGRIGINVTNAETFGVEVAVPTPGTNATGNGTGMQNTGGISMKGSRGGGTFATTTASGGIAGRIIMTGGEGGDVPLATTNATGGAGGPLALAGGQGGMNGVAGAATNATTGGAGGVATLGGGTGGAPNSASTNTVGGAGGNASVSGGAGGTPTAGWASKGGNGGQANLTGGAGGSGSRTNGGNGGAINITGGNSGGSTTSPGDSGVPGDVNISAGSSGSSAGGNASPGGAVNITAGNGSTGTTNSDGGHVYIAGGAPAAGAAAGNTVLNVAPSGAIRGRTGIRVPNPQESLDVQGSTQVSSNVIHTNLVILAATNSTANTNMVMDFNQAVTSITLTNHASFTNIVNLAMGKSKSIVIFITASGGPYNLVWPTLGGSSFGVRIYTNRNSPIFPAVTNKLSVSATSSDTNVHLSVLEWL